MGPVAWFFVCLLLWIVGFPMYLTKRPEYKRVNGKSGSNSLPTLVGVTAIAAVVLGGTSLSGGVGRITGTALGAVIIGVLGNALNLLNVSSYYQMMIKAAVILIAVLIDRKSNK